MLNANFWNKYFHVYDLLNELYPYQDLASTIINTLDVQQGERVLDVGSGTGNIAVKMKERGCVIVGIDSSPEGIEIHRGKDTGAELVLGDVSEPLPFENESFDKIYSNNTIYAISREKRLAIFSELYRVLKPGGKIVVSNILEGFSPFHIYKDHVCLSVERMGFLKTVLKMIKFASPTLRIFYYNYLIQKEHSGGQYDFFSSNEQRDLLKKVGFYDVQPNIEVYSGQGVLNSATKRV
jgi:ubiquinone/menaquinone biosynthesis C-methylase UbiE